ncbi:MAG: hypothetical protein ABH803_02775 [Candidatus Micrarchaeota archaeon]
MKTPFLKIKPNSLESVVFKVMGTTDFETPLDHTTVHPKVWRVINNNRPEGIHKHGANPPGRMNHNILKLPVDVFEGKRKNELDLIKKTIKKTKEVKEYLEINPEEKKSLNRVINHAIFLHTLKSPYYWRTSLTADPKYHKSIYTEAQNIPAEMNRHNARELAKFAHEKLSAGQKEFIFMDTGTGLGTTTRFVLEEIQKINPDHLKKITVVLNDIDKKTLTQVGDKLKQDFGVKLELLPSTFYVAIQALKTKGMKEAWRMADEEVYEKMQKLKGRLDAYTSFASWNNLPHSEIAFKTVKALLKKGGKAFLGDWGGYDITQKEFTQNELDRKINAEGNVTVRKNIKGFWWFWLHHHGCIDLNTNQQKWWRKLERHIDTADKVNVLNWFNSNYKKMEAERKKRGRKYTFFGYANRAYRTPEMVRNAAVKAGLKVKYVGYPLANKKTTENGSITYEPHNPRFVTWHAILEKRSG